MSADPDDDEVKLPLGPSWLGGGGGPTGAAVIALGVGLFLRFSIDGLDYVRLGAGAAAILLALAGLALAARRRAFKSAGLAGLCALAGLGMVASSGLLGSSLPGLGALFGPSVEEVRAKIQEDEELTDVRVTDRGDGRFEFTARRGHDRCSGSFIARGESSSTTNMVCRLPDELPELEAACIDGSAQACRIATERLHDAEPIDWERLNRVTEPGCRLSERTACFYLGVAREHGRGMQVDLAGALRAFERACDRDDRAGCYNAGLMRTQGRGAEADRAAGARRWQAGCELGDQPSCWKLGMAHRDGEGVEADRPRARELFERGCGDGETHGPSCASLGAMYLDGLVGDGPDPTRAVALFERGCEHDSTYGCAMLGDLLRGRHGVTADPPRALRLLAGACEDDDSLACLQAGFMQHEGAEGVAQDRVAALALFERGCTLGSATSCRNCGLYFADGLAGTRDAARARTFFTRGCELGDTPSCDE